MGEATRQTRIVQLALERGLIRAADLPDDPLPPASSSDTAADDDEPCTEPRWGVRIDALLRTGVLVEDEVERLADEIDRGERPGAVDRTTPDLAFLTTIVDGSRASSPSLVDVPTRWDR